VNGIFLVGAFFGLGKLQLLDLSDNRLHSLDDRTFYGLDALEELYLRRNYLVEVAPHALVPVARNLTRLDLAENRLQTIDFQSLAKVDRLTSVDLKSNPWTCDCHLRLPADVGSESLKDAWDHIVCEHPPAASDKLLSSVLGSTIICDDGPPPSTLSPPFDFVDWWSIAIAVLLILCASVLLLIWLCK